MEESDRGKKQRDGSVKRICLHLDDFERWRREAVSKESGQLIKVRKKSGN